MNKFDLEENIHSMQYIEAELETLLYKVGDSAISPTEDELANMIIGMIELQKVRYEKLRHCFFILTRDGKLK